MFPRLLEVIQNRRINDTHICIGTQLFMGDNIDRLIESFELDLLSDKNPINSISLFNNVMTEAEAVKLLEFFINNFIEELIITDNGMHHNRFEPLSIVAEKNTIINSKIKKLKIITESMSLDDVKNISLFLQKSTTLV